MLDEVQQTITLNLGAGRGLFEGVRDVPASLQVLIASLLGGAEPGASTTLARPDDDPESLHVTLRPPDLQFTGLVSGALRAVVVRVRVSVVAGALVFDVEVDAEADALALGGVFSVSGGSSRGEVSQLELTSEAPPLTSLDQLASAIGAGEQLSGLRALGLDASEFAELWLSLDAGTLACARIGVAGPAQILGLEVVVGVELGDDPWLFASLADGVTLELAGLLERAGAPDPGFGALTIDTLGFEAAPGAGLSLTAGVAPGFEHLGDHHLQLVAPAIQQADRKVVKMHQVLGILDDLVL